MNRLAGNHLHRWWIPFTSFAIFFGVTAGLIPYSTSLYEVKKSLAGLVWALASFGTATANTSALDFTYCVFVPFISAYLIYLRWTDLERAAVHPSNLGMGVIVVGVLCYWFGMRAGNQYFGYLAVQILLAGIVLWLWGGTVFRLVLFPWAFFLFTWPLPFLDPIIAFPLRMVMSTLASHLLPLIGIPTLQNGTALVSPPDVLHGIGVGARFQIDIADPCSGIRSLFALLMMSALIGYLFVPKMWQQWVIFLSAFPLAVVGNLARVVMLVLGCIVFGNKFAIGTTDSPSWFHEGCGFLIYAVALGMEFALASLLTRQWNAAPEEAADEDELE
jgi:exosortase